MPTAFGKVEDFQLEQMQAAHPLKKLLQPEEVADVVAHLILLSQQVNGVEFPINAAQNIM
jgi:NADP-dependent 3-hydroxy acid dehydrogenase YdfG